MTVPINEKILLTEVLHPLANDYVDVDRYLGEFGVDATGKRRARCPFCLKHAMEPVLGDEHGAGATGQDDATAVGHARGFVHRDRSAAGACLLVTISLQPTRLRVEHARNPTWHRQHRAAFLAQWQSHYRRMKSHVPSLSVARLISLIAYADVVNLWSHPALALGDIPYVLLALGELIVEPSDAKAAHWVRFVFDGTVQCVDDLWRSRAVAPRLFKIRYRTETLGQLPMWRDIVSCEAVPFGARDVAYIREGDIVIDESIGLGCVHESVSREDVARVDTFIRSGDGLGLVDEPAPDDRTRSPADEQAQVRESLEAYAVSAMRAYARKRGRSV